MHRNCPNPTSNILPLDPQLTLSDCILLDVVLSLSLALVLGTIFLPMSLQHLLCPLSENV